MAIISTSTRWREVILVCKKCSKRLDGGGFGPDGDQSLKKALKKYLRKQLAREGGRSGKGSKAELAVLDAGCFDLCPEAAVVAVNARAPGELLIVPAGSDLIEVRRRLGLEAPARGTVGQEPAA